jgi:hypothetical protein
MKNSNDTIGNRNRDLPACSAVLLRGRSSVLKHLFPETDMSRYKVNCVSCEEAEPIPVAVRSKAWVFGRSLTRIMGSNFTGGIDVCLL